MRALIILAIIIPGIVFGQIDLLNKSLSNPKANHLYAGVDNQIEVTGIQADTSMQLKAVKGGCLKNKQEPGKFVVRVAKGPVDTLRLFLGSTLIFTKVYKVKRIPESQANIGNIRDTSATVEQILSDPTIYATNPSDIIIQEQVVSFSILFSYNQSGKVKKILREGNTFSRKQIRAVKKLKSGDKMLVEDILITGNLYTKKKISPLSIKINGENN